MSKKNIIIVSIIIIVVFSIVFMSHRKSNENGNIFNMGLAVVDENCIYYNKYDKGIFKIKNGEETELIDESAYSLNIYQDNIYYITVSGFNQLKVKSIDINGRNYREIATINTSISKIYVEDGFIYYYTTDNEKRIVRIDINNQDVTSLVYETIQDFQVSNGEIYYINSSNQICKSNVNGDNKKILSENINASKIQVVDDWIYYYNEYENALFRLSSKGNKNELISVLVNNEIYNVYGKYVYYFDKENSKICRMQIGRSNKIQDIVDVSISRTKINIVQNQLYYLDKSSDGSQIYQMFRVKLNGDETNKIEY